MVFYIMQKNKYKTIDKLIEEGDKALTNEPQVFNMVMSGNFSHEQNKFSLGLTQKLSAKNFKFFDRDIYQHFCRIYFLGNNSARQPWKLPINPPATLKPRIILERYHDFVNDINR